MFMHWDDDVPMLSSAGRILSLFITNLQQRRVYKPWLIFITALNFRGMGCRFGQEASSIATPYYTLGILLRLEAL